MNTHIWQESDTQLNHGRTLRRIARTIYTFWGIRAQKCKWKLVRSGYIGHKTKLHRLPTVRCIGIFTRCVLESICEHSKQQLVCEVSMGQDEMEIVESALAFKPIRARVEHKGERHGRKEKVRDRSTAGNKASSRDSFQWRSESPANAVQSSIGNSAVCSNGATLYVWFAAAVW